MCRPVARHEGDDLVGIAGRSCDVGNELAMADNSDAISQPEHLVDVVGDEQDGGALVTKAPSEALHLRGLEHTQGGGRFVQDEQTRAVAHCSGNGQQLALTTGK